LIKSLLTRFSGAAGYRLLIGNGLAQALIFVGIAGISRWYGAAAISVWSAALAFINLVWSFSQLKTDAALLQARDTAEKRLLLGFGLLSHALFSGVSLVVARSFGLFPETHLLLLYSVLASHGIHQMYAACCLSAHAYREVNRMRITNVLLAYPGSLLLLHLSGDEGLLWALLASNLLPTLWLYATGKVPLPGGGQPGTWQSLIRKHLKTMSYLSAGNFLLSLTDQGLILLISRWYGATETAAFFLATRVCNLPLAFVQSAMSQHNMRHFQDLHDAGVFTAQAVTGYWKKWLILGLLYLAPIVLAGPFLFELAFGAEWQVAGQLARIVAVMALFRFLNSPTSMGFFVIGRQRVFFLFTLLATAIFAGTAALAYIRYPLFELVALNSFLQILCILWYNAVMLKHLKTDPVA
jgi:O-antigen/teichoic acid export membrane protein